MGCLEVFVSGVVMESLHGRGAVYAKEDYVAFGVKELEGWELVDGKARGMGSGLTEES